MGAVGHEREMEMNNKVVARYKDGRMVKGATVNFDPSREIFHVIDLDAPFSVPTMVQTRQLKAVFFVKDLIGDPDRTTTSLFATPRPGLGRKVRVEFTDGEVLTGTSAAQPAPSGLFVVPEDPRTNEERAYVLFDATRDVQFL
jgi:hypothetical protein